jgi:16S rRNA (guanine527-N7)-methyltransferase
LTKALTDPALIKDPSKHPIYEALAAIGVPELREKIERLEQYVALLMHWNRRINLTAIRDEAGVWTHHVLDCLAVVPLLRDRSAAQGTHTDAPFLLDAGTGAGLPALLLALAEPSWRVVAVDAVEKKIRFLRHVAAMMALAELKPVHARLEQLGRGEASHSVCPAPGFDMIVSRAFASLIDFVESTQHLLHTGGFYCAMKGQVPHLEIEAFQRVHPNWQLETIVLQVPGLDAQRCAVIMRPPGMTHLASRPMHASN